MSVNTSPTVPLEANLEEDRIEEASKTPKPYSPVIYKGAQATEETTTAAEELRRDLRCLIPLRLLKKLSKTDMAIMSLNLTGTLRKEDVCKALHISLKYYSNRTCKEEFKEAMAQAVWNLQAGVTTAAEVAQACEGDVLSAFYELALDPGVNFEWRYKFGCKVLDHRKEMVKAMGGGSTPVGRELALIAPEVDKEMESRVKERMVDHLGDTNNKPILKVLREGLVGVEKDE